MAIYLFGCTLSASDPPATPGSATQTAIAATRQSVIMTMTARAAPTSTPTPTFTSTQGPTATRTTRPSETSTSTPTPPPVDVPWYYQDAVHFAVDVGHLEPENSTTFGSDDEGVFAWQHYRAARRIRFGDDNLPNPVWKFLDLDPASELTKLDDEIVRLVAPYVEDLLSRGLLFGCGLRNNPPIVCPQRQARVNTIAILVTVGEWDPPSQKEIEDDKDFPKDLSKSSVFAPYVKVFNDLGCLEPGTNPPDEVRPFRKTTKLQAAVWYYCFSQNLQTEN